MVNTDELIIGFSSLFLLLASYFDLKTGEIPEKLSRGFIVITLALAIGCTLITLNPSYMLFSAGSGVIFFLVGYLMFYLGEWGGGDVKILSGVGCSLGLLSAFGFFLRQESIFPYTLNYFINFALAATPYVILYASVLGILKPNVLNSFFSNLFDKKNIFLIILAFVPAALAIYLQTNKAAFVYLFIPFFVVLSLYLKEIEDNALQKSIPVNELKEEDILAKDIIVEGKKVAGRREAGGLTKKQVEEIKALAASGKIPSEIRVRWGIRFIPVFFLAYLMTCMWGDVLEIIVRYIMT